MDDYDPRRWWGLCAPSDSLPRLGMGADFEEPDRRRSLADGRDRFLFAALGCKPQLLDRLADEPLRCYRRLPLGLRLTAEGRRDRKSTRLNFSHANISYAVFCLKKKNIMR